MGLIAKNNIQLLDGADFSWQEAIQKSAEPLLQTGVIAQEYVDDVIEVCREKGPYMNIGPDVVLGHARPLASTKKAAISLLVTKAVIPFMNDDRHPARIWFLLATPDDTSHMQLLQQLASVLMNPDNLKHMLTAASVDELEKIVNPQ